MIAHCAARCSSKPSVKPSSGGRDEIANQLATHDHHLPLYEPSPGLSVLERRRGDDTWQAYLPVEPKLTTDMLILPGKDRQLDLSIHAMKAQRRGWIRSVSLPYMHAARGEPRTSCVCTAGIYTPLERAATHGETYGSLAALSAASSAACRAIRSGAGLRGSTARAAPAQGVRPGPSAV